MHRCSTFLYVPNAFPLTFRKILLRSDLPTSIMHSCRHWVTCPQEALAITFLYVPDTFLYVPWGPLTLGFVGFRGSRTKFRLLGHLTRDMGQTQPDRRFSMIAGPGSNQARFRLLGQLPQDMAQTRPDCRFSMSSVLDTDKK